MVVAREEREAHKKKPIVRLPSLQLVLDVTKLALAAYCLWLLSHDIIEELLRRIATSQ